MRVSRGLRQGSDSFCVRSLAWGSGFGPLFCKSLGNEGASSERLHLTPGCPWHLAPALAPLTPLCSRRLGADLPRFCFTPSCSDALAPPPCPLPMALGSGPRQQERAEGSEMSVHITHTSTHTHTHAHTHTTHTSTHTHICTHTIHTHAHHAQTTPLHLARTHTHTHCMLCMYLAHTPAWQRAPGHSGTTGLSPGSGSGS